MQKKHKQDRLSRWAAAAKSEGMRYGAWVAKCHPPGSPLSGRAPDSKAPVVRICAHCHSEFTQYDRRQRKYCCEEHQIAANKRMEYERKAALREKDEQLAKRRTKKEKPSAPDRYCALCGTKITETGRAKYCGEQCAAKAHIEQVRAYQARKVLGG